ncbi:hypothetical protein [Olivibacter domesticus]|uniref:Transcription elongation factor, GreA/GreB, C-term n=1 Tax=Olivibacter domesticus TaxID=407022 RepID=A0A1H7QWQ0_OLID1|nr:hypothetical protein [Olivibacter domesticus]SEL52124.1 hypothetical protein SAMN05661044_02748 [Olivibacter domesticus]
MADKLDPALQSKKEIRAKKNSFVKLRALKGDLKLYLALSTIKKIPKGYQFVSEYSPLGRSIVNAKEGDIICLSTFRQPYKFLVLQVID